MALPLPSACPQCKRVSGRGSPNSLTRKGTPLPARCRRRPRTCMRSSQKGFSRRITVITVAILVLVGTGLRGFRLASPTLWVDEAESALNALTIVADGVPRDHILGQPIYENTLVRPWPESAEYEFRDISYSDRGLAVYHSWLPLYSIAAAFRLAGVTQQSARGGTPLRDASPAEIERWTLVPRLPAVGLGAISIVAAWALGRRVHGHQAAIAMAFAVATSDFFVRAGRQARYYSAAVAGNTLCGLAIWNAWRRGRLVDHALAGLAVGVLFHIHSVSAVGMSGFYVARLLRWAGISRGSGCAWRPLEASPVCSSCRGPSGRDSSGKLFGHPPLADTSTCGWCSRRCQPVQRCGPRSPAGSSGSPQLAARAVISPPGGDARSSKAPSACVSPLAGWRCCT